MITLLNNQPYRTEEILGYMMDDEFYYGVLATNALGSSLLRNLLDSPNTLLEYMKKPKKETDALRIGRLTHECFLEPKKFYDKVYVEADRTNAKVYKDAVAEHGADRVYKQKEKDYVEWLIRKLANNEIIQSIMKDADVEVPMIRMFDEFAIRGKADILTDDCIYDLKTTIAPTESFAKWEVDKKNYDLQAFIYCRLFKKDKFKFITLNKNNRDVGIVNVPAEVLSRGETKFNLALKAYKEMFYKKTLEETEYVLDQYILEIDAK